MVAVAPEHRHIAVAAAAQKRSPRQRAHRQMRVIIPHSWVLSSAVVMEIGCEIGKICDVLHLVGRSCESMHRKTEVWKSAAPSQPWEVPASCVCSGECL
jgi:hypothetical protein